MSQLLEVRACKTEGCDGEANGRYDRGPYAGLCVEVCIPRKREEMAEQARERHRERREGGRSGKTMGDEIRELAKGNGEPVDDAPGPESLTEIAARYEAAREELAAAREALDEAAAALREHPVLAELLSER